MPATRTIEADAGAIGGKWFSLTGVNHDAAVAWSDVAAAADVEILCAFIAPDVALATWPLYGPLVRAGGGTARSGYFCGIVSATNLGVAKAINGSETMISSVSLGASFFVSGSKYWIRMRVSGTTLQARAWLDGTEEPGTWAINTTDSAIPDAGVVGFRNDINWRNPKLDYFAVGTGGDAAPSPSSGPVAVNFVGPIPDQTTLRDAAYSLNVASYFGGTATPFTYSVLAGTLPAGLSLSGGTISGTPTVLGTSSGIVIRATDQDSATADSNAFAITINSGTPTLVISEPLKNNTGTLRANQTGVRVAVLQSADLVSVYEASALTTDAAGVLEPITSAMMTAGQQYHVAIKLADGGVGISGAVTAV